LCQRPGSFSGRQRWLRRRTEHPRLSDPDCTLARESRRRRPTAPRLAVSFRLSATVRVPEWVSHAGCLLCLSRVSVHNESAKATPLVLCRRPKHSQRKGRIAIVSTCLLSPGSKPPAEPAQKGAGHHRPKHRSREPLSTRSGSLCLSRVSVLRGLLPLHSASAELRCLSDDVAGDLNALLEQHVLVLAFIVHCINRLQWRIELVKLLC
jgi:hypothetical protein